MKKLLTLVLAAALILSLTASAFAATGSPSSRPSDPINIDPVSPTRPGPRPSTGTPESHTQLSEDIGCDCRLVPWALRDTLPGDKKKNFEDARDCLDAAVPEGFSCPEFTYHEIRDFCEICNVLITEDPDHIAWELDAAEESSIRCCNSILESGELVVCSVCIDRFPVGGYSDYAVKQYVDGQWITLEFVVVDDVLNILGVVDGPLALFVK